MGDAPFFKGTKEEETPDRDEAVEAALDAADKADDKVVDAKAAKAEADEEVNALFPSDEDTAEAAAADDDGTDEALFDEPSKTPKGWTEKTYARFKQVIGQRNAGRKTIETLTKGAATNEEFMRTLGDKYANYANPTAVLRADADFMDAFEELAKTTPSIAAIADQVKAFQSTGRIPVSDGQPIGQVNPARVQAQEAAPKQDPQVAKLIEQGARTTINTTLAGLKVKPAFQKLIADSMVASGTDLASLDATTVIAQAKSFISDNGFSAAEVLTEVASPDASKGKPNTGGKSKPATSEKTASASGDGESNTPAAPKTRDEWESNRTKIRDAMFSAD